MLLSSEIKQLIDRPNFAHVATLMPELAKRHNGLGGKRWRSNRHQYHRQLSAGAEHQARSARGDFVVDFHNPYEEVQLRGRVVERRPVRI